MWAFPFSTISLSKAYLRTLLSLSAQGHLSSHCRLGFVIIFDIFEAVSQILEKKRERKKDIVDIAAMLMWWNGELMAGHSCRRLNSACREVSVEHRERETGLHIYHVCIHTYVCVVGKTSKKWAWFSNSGPVLAHEYLSPYRSYCTKQSHLLPALHWGLRGVQVHFLVHSLYSIICSESNGMLLWCQHVENTCWKQVFLFNFLEASKNILAIHSHFLPKLWKTSKNSTSETDPLLFFAPIRCC